MKKLLAIVLVASFAFVGAFNASAVTIEELQAQIATLLQQIAALSGTTTPAATTTTCFSTDLYQGMTHGDVKLLQEKLGVINTSYFGPLTLAAVKTYQGANGIPTTGYVGPMTRASLNAKYCVAAPVTTTAAGTTTTTIVAGTTEGSLTVKTAASPANNTEAKAGSSDVAVAAMEVKATGNAVNLNRIYINFNTRVWRSISDISLWDGTTMISKVSGLTSTSFEEIAVGTDYRFAFSGLSIALAKDQTKTLTIKISVPTVQDSATDSTITFGANCVRGTDAIGLTQQAPTAALAATRTIDFTTKAAGKLEVTANTGNAQKIVILGTVSTTTDVEMAKIDFKAKENDSTLRTLKVTVTSGAAAGNNDESEVVPTIKLYDGTTLLSSQTVAAGGAVIFTDLTVALAKDTTKTLTIKGDFYKIYDANGDGVADPGDLGLEATDVTVALTGVTQTDIVAEDANYDTVTTANITATQSFGKTLYTYSKAPTFTLVSTAISATPDKANKEADATITFTVTANGGDIYLNDYVTSTAGKRAFTGLSTDPVAGGNAPTVTYSFTSADATKTLDVADYYYTIRNGETKTFTMSIHIVSPVGEAGFHKAYVGQFKWGTALTNETTRSANAYTITTLNLDTFITNALNLTAS